MVLSYSKAAQYSTSSATTPESGGSGAQNESTTPKVFSKQTSTTKPDSEQDTASAFAPVSSSSPAIQPSEPVASSSSTLSPIHGEGKPLIAHLILDAGPLLSLTPLRYLATKLYTTPAVLAELRDPKAREYLQRIRDGVEGWELEVVVPSAESMARVIAFAKKTGDYAVLSSTDLGVIALTLQYEMKENGTEGLRLEPGQKAKVQPRQVEAGPSGTGSGSGQPNLIIEESSAGIEGLEDNQEAAGEKYGEGNHGAQKEEADLENGTDASIGSSSNPLIDHTTPSSTSAELVNGVSGLSMSDQSTASSSTSTSPPNLAPASAPGADDEEDSDSDAGDWITPSTLSTHRSRDLGHLPEGGKSSAKALAAACMTGDFAVQNVLLAMGLGVVGEGGKRIGKVKSWVLRCHACFKICKDPSKKFCPSCGNPTLLRTSTTTTSNGKTHLHLKKNYQYNLRGSKFTIPDAKPGRAKGQLKGGTGLILREDQREWMDAVKMEEGRKGKEQKKMLKGWDDPDWMPEIITVGMSGKGRMGAHGLPNIGHGRKNPNIAKKKR